MNGSLTALVDSLALLGWAIGLASACYLQFIRDRPAPLRALVPVWCISLGLGLLAARVWVPGYVASARAVAVILLVVAEFVTIEHAAHEGESK